MQFRIHHLILTSILVALGIFTFMITTLFDKGDIVFTNIQSYTGPVVTKYNPYTGSSAPEVRLILYSNFTCPNCAQFSQTVREAIADKNVVLIWKDLPNDSLNTSSTQASLAAHCANDQGRFWQYHDALMEQHGNFSDIIFSDIASQRGLNERRMKKCINKKTFQPVIDQSVDEAEQLRITTAPTLFIGNDRFATGTIDANTLRERLDIILGL